MAVKAASKLTLLLTDLVEHHSAEGREKLSCRPSGQPCVVVRKAALFV